MPASELDRAAPHEGFGEAAAVPAE
jgi:hypothetical protein